MSPLNYSAVCCKLTPFYGVPPGHGCPLRYHPGVSLHHAVFFLSPPSVLPRLLLPLAAMLLEVMGTLRIVQHMREQRLFISGAAGVHWLCSGRAFAVPHLVGILVRNNQRWTGAMSEILPRCHCRGR